MKKLLNIIALFFLISSSTVIAQQTPGKETTPSKIIGVAKDAKTGEPVAYATAALYAAGGDTNVAGAVADGDGKFFITGMDPGTYDLKISFLGFETKTISGIQVV
ncbi:MAG: carboxypeptidase-like regulatory domain-containing protein, partial [Algoriphagus sp.]